MIGRRAGLVVVLPWAVCAGSIPAGAFQPLCGLLRGALAVPGQLHRVFGFLASMGLFVAFSALLCRWSSWPCPVMAGRSPSVTARGLEFDRLRRFASSMGIWSTSA